MDMGPRVLAGIWLVESHRVDRPGNRQADGTMFCGNRQADGTRFREIARLMGPWLWLSIGVCGVVHGGMRGEAEFGLSLDLATDSPEAWDHFSPGGWDRVFGIRQVDGTTVGIRRVDGTTFRQEDGTVFLEFARWMGPRLGFAGWMGPRLGFARWMGPLLGHARWMGPCVVHGQGRVAAVGLVFGVVWLAMEMVDGPWVDDGIRITVLPDDDAECRRGGTHEFSGVINERCDGSSSSVVIGAWFTGDSAL